MTEIIALVGLLNISEKPIPPHDLEMYDDAGRVVARWDGRLLDEIGSRAQITANLNSIAAAYNMVNAGHAHYWHKVAGDRTIYGSPKPDPDCLYCQQMAER